MKKVTVLIPCFNEAASIAGVIAKFPSERLAANNFTLDFLIVDNNSTDGTAQVAKRAGARVLFEPMQGKGCAVRTGFRSLTKDTDYVVMLDGDDTYRPEEVLRLLEPVDSGFAKVVIGSRLQGRIGDGSMRSVNKIGNCMYSSLVRRGYHVKVSDTLSGYYAWSREVIDNLTPHLFAKDFTIEMEMVTKMARLGYEIFSVPISYYPRRGSSSLRPFADGIRILKTYAENLQWNPNSLRAIQAANRSQELSQELALSNDTGPNGVRTLSYRESEENRLRI